MKRILLMLAIIAGFITLVSFSVDFDLTKDVLTYTNKFRESKRKSTLEMSDELNKIALKHSENMAAGKIAFGHSGVEGREKLAIKAYPNLQAFAENVAYGPTTGQSVVEGWKASPGHRANMLGNYKYIGIGVAKSANGTIYYTQVFANTRD